LPTRVVYALHTPMTRPMSCGPSPDPAMAPPAVHGLEAIGQRITN
jgi:hypothetical protein